MSSTPQAWKLRVRHMLEAISACREYVHGLTQEQLAGNPLVLHAIAWNLTILGEAARHVPDDITNSNPDIPWAQIRGMRNHIVHGYDRIDLEILWNVATAELPPLVPSLERIVQEPPTA
jgi:uncharacterized protein with HEPN domain